MKRRNSVFNNYNSESKYSSNMRKNFNLRNGFLDSQNEFADEFFEDLDDQFDDDEIRERKSTIRLQSSRGNNTRRKNIL